MHKLYGKLGKAHMKANANLTLTPEGNGGYDLDDDLMPSMKKPQSQAQRNAVKKAGKVSAMRRKIAAGKAFGPPKGY